MTFQPLAERGGQQGRVARCARVVAVGVVGATLGPAVWAASDMSGTFLGVPNVVWAWANIAVFWGLIWKLAGPSVKEFLAKRREGIAEGIDRAANQAAEAKQMRADLAAQLEEFRTELGEQKERARVEAQRERERILEQAEAERTKLLEQTEREIENQTARARGELRKVAAGLVADLAAQNLSSSLNGGDRDRLFQQDLDRLSAWKTSSADQGSSEAAS